jgi:hypothetical protein
LQYLLKRIIDIQTYVKEILIIKFTRYLKGDVNKFYGRNLMGIQRLTLYDACRSGAVDLDHLERAAIIPYLFILIEDRPPKKDYLQLLGIDIGIKTGSSESICQEDYFPPSLFKQLQEQFMTLIMSLSSLIFNSCSGGEWYKQILVSRFKQLQEQFMTLIMSLSSLIFNLYSGGGWYKRMLVSRVSVAQLN